MAKITDRPKAGHETVTVRTKAKVESGARGTTWWKAASKRERAAQVVETFAFIKEVQQYRMRQASIHARLYGNIPLSNWAGSSLSRGSANAVLPIDRPTFNVVQSCIDTLCSRISQSRPRPIFLTDNANHKQRTLAKQMNAFLDGELYQTKAYQLGEDILRDAAILGTGCIKVLENNNRVALERVLATELFIDANDGFYAKPRSLYQMKLVDRSVLAELMPEFKGIISDAEQAYPDAGGESQRTTADQVMVIEAWHLPSGPNAADGKHVIACSAGSLVDEEYDKEDFPFVFLHYSPRLIGFWSQGLSEQLMGTQVEINKLLVTISKSISLVGVPRVFVEDGSKVVKAHLNDQIGAIVTYRGEKPIYEVAPCVPQELYAQLQRLIDYSYQQSGISALAAASQKPQGLDSGTALREFDDLQSDRFATLNKRFDHIFIDLGYKIIDKAKDICEREGTYQTIYPAKDGTQEINLPDADKLDNPFVIRCYDSSGLPKDPAGRSQKIIEFMQAGIYSQEEGRRLLNLPDTEREDLLASAAKERILKQLDGIVEDGAYEPPDPFTDLQQGMVLVNQYYNLYTTLKLEESRAEMLRQYKSQLDTMQQAMMPPPMPGMPPGAAPTGVPEAPPTNDLLPINQG